MGPRSGERGEAAGLVDVYRVDGSFNGAALGRARRGLAQHLARRQGHSASMGPRSGERGEVWSENGDVTDLFASMGPRSGERGERIQRPHVVQGRDASMGPRSGERGENG